MRSKGLASCFLNEQVRAYETTAGKSKFAYIISCWNTNPTSADNFIVRASKRTVVPCTCKCAFKVWEKTVRIWIFYIIIYIFSKLQIFPHIVGNITPQCWGSAWECLRKYFWNYLVSLNRYLNHILVLICIMRMRNSICEAERSTFYSFASPWDRTSYSSLGIYLKCVWKQYPKFGISLGEILNCRAINCKPGGKLMYFVNSNFK